MSLPLFSNRDPLEFSRDREDDVLLFTTDTRIWPSDNITERRAAHQDPPGRDPA